MKIQIRQQFIEGLRAGVPIMLGYIPVAFTYGSMAVGGGLTPLTATLISLTNITSSGQVAATQVILAGGSVIEIIVVTLIINIRYLLMGLSLSQKLAPAIPLWQKAVFSFGVTDETFALASMRKEPITFPFMAGLILLPIFGWVFGTALYSIAMEFLPETLKSALGIALYGMFICLLIPPSKKDKMILLVVLLSAALSCILFYVPWFSLLSSGWAVIICAVAGAAVGAAVTCARNKEAGECN